MSRSTRDSTGRYNRVFPTEDVYEAAMAADNFRSSRSGLLSAEMRASFRTSVSSIPTPDERLRPPKYEPFLLKLWVVIVGSVLMIVLAVALEVVLQISQERGGITVPQRNVFSFASTQFLTSFFPTLLMIPLSYLITTFDWNVRWWQPYVLLSTGNRRAEETLLLDYVPLNRFLILKKAIKFRHMLVIFSTVTALGANILQPLAGSLFSIRQLPQTQDSTAQSIRTIGLSPDIDDLNAFSSSAGFAEAAVFNSLPDPPFIHGGWAAAQFIFPTNSDLNGSVAVNTTAIQTAVNCANPLITTVDTANPSNFSISGISVDGCAGGPAFFNPSNAAQQYGVLNVPNCGENAPSNASFQPVMFWPTLQLFDVMAYADLNNDNLTSVQPLDNYPKPNNVTGAPLNGNIYNGLIFDPSSDINVQARATSIKSGIPNAIFRGAAQNASGLQAVFDDPNGFRDLTSTIYTQYLALASKSIYFLPVNDQVFSRVTQLVPRLWIEPLSAHFLATILVLESLAILYIHISHHRARRNVYLSHAPGSIGTVISQTSRSGFGELLLPYDDAARMKWKLEGLRFRLDERTCAIVVDDSAVQYVDGKCRPSPHDEAMNKLEGKHRAGAGKPQSPSTSDDKGEGGSIGEYPPVAVTNVPSLQYAPGTKLDGSQRPLLDA